ncbi:hypothetical protein K0U83_13850 [bacterium]|nr:hypothetical protein [bacterium]
MDDDDFQADESVVETPDVAVNDEAPHAPRTVEDIAAGMGWTPRENWRGPEDKWKPADEFVAATAEINSKVTTKLKTLEEQLSHINRTNAMVTERLLAEQREKLLQEKQEAFDIGDRAKMDEADAKLGQLPTVAVQTPVAPEVENFIQKHASWWNKDQEATNWVVSRANQLIEQGITSPARHAAIIERELGSYFPEYAPQTAQPKAKAAPLTQPGRRGNTPRAITLSDLPKEAREAAAYFKTKGVSEEQYLASWNEGQSA